MKKLAASLYVAVCLSGAFLFLNGSLEDAYSATHLKPVAVMVQRADAMDQTPYEDSDSREMARMERHLDYTDERLNNVADALSMVKGIGTGAMAVLGILQILNLIATRNKS